jgi:hypothetical protein
MIEQKYKNSILRRCQTKEGKWNLQNKETDEYISNIWFDNLGTWSSFSCFEGEEHDIFGWDGLIFLEQPIKTPNSAYPYIVKATIYHYNDKGDLLSVDENSCGIWGYGYVENVVF